MFVVIHIVEYFLHKVNEITENFLSYKKEVEMFEKIEALCKKENISVAALEGKLGFGKCTILKWKTSNPTVDKLKKVADYFGVTIDYFLEAV